MSDAEVQHFMDDDSFLSSTTTSQWVESRAKSPEKSRKVRKSPEKSRKVQKGPEKSIASLGPFECHSTHCISCRVLEKLIQNLDTLSYDGPYIS
jgi:hypothetical protein